MNENPEQQYSKLFAHLLDADDDGNYFEPLIGPTEGSIDFAWLNYSLVIYPDGHWELHEEAK